MDHADTSAPASVEKVTPPASQERRTIRLHHHELGALEVAIEDEATWWLRQRHWFCPDEPEYGTFDDGEFEETPEQINALLTAPPDP
jgi:hypothetical protein